MKNNIYSNLLKINNSKQFSLKYMSLLNCISYECLRTRIKRNGEIEEELLYRLIQNYNLTFAQLNNYQNGESYHKMIDQKYYWNIIHYVNTAEISKQTGLKQIAAILFNADGTYYYQNKNITFIPEYNITDYLKYSASLVLINKTKKIRNNSLDPIIESIEEEISIIQNCLDRINNNYGKDVLKDIFYYRYIIGLDSDSIQKKLNIKRNRYYKLLNESNVIAYRSFGLYTNEEIKRKISCISDF